MRVASDPGPNDSESYVGPVVLSNWPVTFPPKSRFCEPNTLYSHAGIALSTR